MRKFIKLLFILQDKLEDDKSTTLLSLKAENSKGVWREVGRNRKQSEVQRTGPAFQFCYRRYFPTERKEK